MKVDTTKIGTEIANIQKQLGQYIGTKRSLEKQIDNLDIEDRHYDRKLSGLQDRLDKYFEILRDNEFTESIYVVAADKDFCRSLRNDKEIVAFDSLNKFLNYIIIHTIYLAEAVSRQMESSVIDKFIKDNIVDEVYTANCDVDGCYDELLTITCEPESISIPKETIIAMDEWSLSEKEIVSQTIDDN